MARTARRTTRYEAATKQGRADKARQFFEAASMIETLVDDGDLADAYVTLCVHAGIAAADVICCVALGKHATGDDHHQAVALLRQVDGVAAKHLSDLLTLKTKSGYSHLPSSAAERRRAGRAAQALIETANLR